MSDPASSTHARPLAIGITCYPTFGGSGIIATEVGLAMAARGHRVHFICSDVPSRLLAGAPPEERLADHDSPTGWPENVRFHRVVARDYPVFPYAPYSLALASSMVSVANSEGLDVLHVHYAVPHATSAWMAGEVLGARRPRIITTLHGTDITLVGADPSYLPITRHSVLKSDAITTPSAFLRDETWRRLDLAPETTPIEVIPNFVDVSRFRPLDRPAVEDVLAGPLARPLLADLFGAEAEVSPVLVHVSNFRPVKRVQDVVAVFARVNATRPSLLLMVGDGPERPAAEALAAQLGVAERVRFVGHHDHFEAVLRECSLFVLPSESESFGLAALEALASGVPVVATAVGGLPDVVLPGQTGALVPVGDVPAMAAAALDLLRDPARHRALSKAARADVCDRFQHGPLTARYEALYRRVLAAPRAA